WPWWTGCPSSKRVGLVRAGYGGTGGRIGWSDWLVPDWLVAWLEGDAVGLQVEQVVGGRLVQAVDDRRPAGRGLRRGRGRGDLLRRGLAGAGGLLRGGRVDPLPVVRQRERAHQDGLAAPVPFPPGVVQHRLKGAHL